MKQFLLVSLLLLIALTSNAQTPGTMNIGTIVSSHWPSPSPSIMRPRWGAEWRQIETARGTYSWSLMDGWIAAAQQHNTQILFTFLDVPSWVDERYYRASTRLERRGRTLPGSIGGCSTSRGRLHVRRVCDRTDATCVRSNIAAQRSAERQMHDPDLRIVE